MQSLGMFDREIKNTQTVRRHWMMWRSNLYSILDRFGFVQVLFIFTGFYAFWQYFRKPEHDESRQDKRAPKLTTSFFLPYILLINERG